MTDIHNLAASLVECKRTYIQEYPKHINNNVLIKQKETLDESKKTIDALGFMRTICSVGSMKYKTHVVASRVENYSLGISGLAFDVQIGFSPLEYGNLYDFLTDFYRDTVGNHTAVSLMKKIVSASMNVEYRNNDDVPMDHHLVPLINLDPNMALDGEDLERCYETMRKQLMDYALNKDNPHTLFRNVDFTLMQGATRVLIDFSLIVPLCDDLSERLLNQVYGPCKE